MVNVLPLVRRMCRCFFNYCAFADEDVLILV